MADKGLSLGDDAQSIEVFFDPISMEVMRNPVIAEDGHIYERDTIQRWLSFHNVSPLTNAPMGSKLEDNDQVRTAINEFIQKHSHVLADQHLHSENLTPLHRMGDVLATIHWRVPQIVALGNDGGGKSTLLERISGYPVFPHETPSGTQIPVRLQLRRGPFRVPEIMQLKLNPNLQAPHRSSAGSNNSATALRANQSRSSRDRGPEFSSTGRGAAPNRLVRSGSGGMPRNVVGLSRGLSRVNPPSSTASVVEQLVMENAFEVIRDHMREISQQPQQENTSVELVVRVQSPTCPDLDIIDMPNISGQESMDLINRYLIQNSEHSLFLVIVDGSSPNDCLPSNPILDAVRKYELESKTICVVTKLDAIAKENSVKDLLQVLTPYAPRYGVSFTSSVLPNNYHSMGYPRRYLLMTEAESVLFAAAKLDRDVSGLQAARKCLFAAYEDYLRANWAEGAAKELSEEVARVEKRIRALGFPYEHEGVTKKDIQEAINARSREILEELHSSVSSMVQEWLTVKLQKFVMVEDDMDEEVDSAEDVLPSASRFSVNLTALASSCCDRIARSLRDDDFVKSIIQEGGGGIPLEHFVQTALTTDPSEMQLGRFSKFISQVVTRLHSLLAPATAAVAKEVADVLSELSSHSAFFTVVPGEPAMSAPTSARSKTPTVTTRLVLARNHPRGYVSGRIGQAILDSCVLPLVCVENAFLELIPDADDIITEESTTVKRNELVQYRQSTLEQALVCVAGLLNKTVVDVKSENNDSRAWRDMPRIFGGGRRDCATAAGNGRLFIIGGFDWTFFLDTCVSMDMRTGRWTELPKMSAKRRDCAVVWLENRLFVFGGCDGASYLNSAEAFDIASNSWSRLPPMRSRRGFCSACVVGTKIYVIGGWDGSSTLSSMEIFEPRSRTWTTSPSATSNMASARSGCAAVCAEGCVYVIGGFDGERYLDTGEMLVRSTEWSAHLSAMSAKRAYCAAVAHKGKILVCGGYDGEGCLSSVEQYDIHSNAWFKVVDLSVPRGYCAAAVWDNMVIVVGGFDGNSELETIEALDLD